MTRDEFLAKLKNAPRPVLVELWAPWCGPCKVMAPRLKRVGDKFTGRVELVKINADESAEVVKDLRVMGIPTLIAFNGGKEIFRKVGAQSEEALEAIFEAAQIAETPKTTLQPMERGLRFLAGAALTIFGISSGPSWVLVGVGALVLFSAVYDRCPIYAAISARVKRAFNQE